MTEKKKHSSIGETITQSVIEDELKTSYLDYAMSVIVGRALPDVRDGLKPVHRRILHAMLERRWTHEKAYVKSAKIVGEVIGNYHPHGDMAVYDTIVRMVQTFSLRVPLIDGQGNFGSIDGDGAAAYRYTEARLSRAAEELLKDIGKETVDFTSNFDDTKKEPVVLPASLPNLLVNGTNGIAVGMATNIPPHNLEETINACISYIENTEISIPELMKIIKGPDFPTAGLIHGVQGIRQAYQTGRGKITLRAFMEVEDFKNGRQRIIVKEIPYQVNKSNLVEGIANLVKDKKIEGISGLRDESDRTGMRIIIELRKGANDQILINQLYKHTQLQITYGIIMLALVKNRPVVMDLKQVIRHYVEHRQEVVVRRTKFDLRKAQDRAHILEGLIKALENIDKVIETIKSSKTVESARIKLMANFDLSELQAVAILEMRLQRLTALEVDKIRAEYNDLLKIIAHLKALLASDKKIDEVVRKELEEIRDKYKTPRLTQIIKQDIEDFTIEDILADEDMVISISHAGYIKRLPIDTYKRQRRGGKGVKSAKVKEEDYIEGLVVASTHSTILFFTNKGKVFWLKVHEITQESKISKGRPIRSLLNLGTGEQITTIVGIKDFEEDSSLIMVTRKGVIKKTLTNGFSNARKKGITALALDNGDELIDVKHVTGDQDVFIGTAKGRGLRFALSKVRNMGRAARGIKGLTLSEKDHIIGMTLVDKKSILLVLTEAGYGKRVEYDNFSVKGRGGKGMTYEKVTERTRDSVKILSVLENDEVMIVSEKGIMIRTTVASISIQGRSTQGVRVMSLNKGDRIRDVALIMENIDQEDS